MNLTTLLGSNWIQGSTVNTTSGTAVALTTTVPSNMKMMEIFFNGISTNGSYNLLLRLGSGSYQSSGYTGVTSSPNSNGANATDGVLLQSYGADPTRNWYGWSRIVLLGSNTYYVYGFVAPSNYNSYTNQFTYTVSLSGALDRVQLTTTTGGDTFDAGSTTTVYFS